jgi:hypothetical protein
MKHLSGPPRENPTLALPVELRNLVSPQAADPGVRPGPVVMAITSISSSGRGESATRTSSESKWLRT